MGLFKNKKFIPSPALSTQSTTQLIQPFNEIYAAGFIYQKDKVVKERMHLFATVRNLQLSLIFHPALVIYDIRLYFESLSPLIPLLHNSVLTTWNRAGHCRLMGGDGKDRQIPLRKIKGQESEARIYRQVC